DAAVLGTVFWEEAVASMGGRDPEAVVDGLHQLAQKELIRHVRASSVAGQSEYAFWHVLVRDVAYAQIPRAERARKHRAAADWIEQLAGDRVADHAELLAHHYREALALARAAGLPEQELVQGARRFVIEAAGRAERPHPASARALYPATLSPLAEEGPRRTAVLGRFGWLTFYAGDYLEAQKPFRAAVDEGDALGSPAEAADAVSGLSFLYSMSGETRRADELLEHWVDRLDSNTPEPALGSPHPELARRPRLPRRFGERIRPPDPRPAARTRPRP